MTIEEEDEIIRQAEVIKGRTFREAEMRWEQTPDSEKRRPWPRCWNLTCNRTGTCQSDGTKDEFGRTTCEGWDF